MTFWDFCDDFGLILGLLVSIVIVITIIVIIIIIITITIVVVITTPIISGTEQKAEIQVPRLRYLRLGT